MCLPLSIATSGPNPVAPRDCDIDASSNSFSMSAVEPETMKSLFTKCAALVAACLLGISARADDLKLGVQTWTLRNLSFDQVVEFCTKHKIKYVELIPNHIGLDDSKEQWQKKKDAMEKAGLVPYTFGVAGTSPTARQCGSDASTSDARAYASTRADHVRIDALFSG